MISGIGNQVDGVRWKLGFRHSIDIPHAEDRLLDSPVTRVVGFETGIQDVLHNTVWRE